MNFTEVFEPDVYGHFGYGVNGAAVSQAISLKRIADAIEKIVVFVEGTAKKPNAASPKR